MQAQVAIIVRNAITRFMIWGIDRIDETMVPEASNLSYT